jgi:hypothetical protein
MRFLVGGVGGEGGGVNGQVMADLLVLVRYFDHLPGRHPIISTWSSSWHLLLFLRRPLCPVRMTRPPHATCTSGGDFAINAPLHFGLQVATNVLLLVCIFLCYRRPHYLAI